MVFTASMVPIMTARTTIDPALARGRAFCLITFFRYSWFVLMVYWGYCCASFSWTALAFPGSLRRMITMVTLSKYLFPVISCSSERYIMTIGLELNLEREFVNPIIVNF